MKINRVNRPDPPKPKALETQIDYPDSQLTFYEETYDQDFGVSSDQWTD